VPDSNGTIALYSYPELFGVADRILVMRRGRLAGGFVTKETTPEEVMHLAAVEEKA